MAMAVPTTRRIYLNVSGAANDNQRGDAAKLLSRHNHRLYRQGRNYQIRIGLDHNVNGVYEVYALRPDWMIMKAWQKAFETFMNNSKEELRSVGSSKARWQDFRVNGLELVGSNGEFEGTMRGALAPTNVSISSGEFVSSSVRDEAGALYRFSWTSPTGPAVWNILEEYDKMGNANKVPTTALTETGYGGLDDDANNDQAAHLTADGNDPPYDATGLESSTPLIKIATIGQTAPGLGVLSTGFFDAPCGLFIVRRISGDAWSTTGADFYMEAKSGSYKGVASESMGTAKLVKNHYEVK